MDEEWEPVRAPAEAELAAAAAGWAAEAEEEEERPLKVEFAAPAAHWTDAAPIGNGRLGAMVWGGVATETLQLNLDTLWTGVPGDYTNPNAPPVLSKVRELVDEGKYYEATTVAGDLSDRSPNSYQPLGTINLEFEGHNAQYSSYHRELDLYTATVTVTYTIGKVEYTREHFASNPQQVLVTKISSKEAGQLSFTLSLVSQLNYQTSTIQANQIIIEGACPGKRRSKENAVDSSGIKFSAILHLQLGGANARSQALNGEKLRVASADWAVLILSAASSFEGPFSNPSDSKLDPSAAAQSTINLVTDLSYSQLKTYHLDDYQSLFQRVTLRLSEVTVNTGTGLDPPTCNPADSNYSIGTVKSTAERIKNFVHDEDPSLVELLFHYGRYLMIASSRPGTQISNLQGIWSKDIEPPWDCAPHLNINLQMNYWPALPCDISECQQPLFDFIASLAANGSKTAKINYGAGGWVTHQVTDLWAKTSPDAGDPSWACWQMGGAWIATHLWEHYSYTLDKSFLETTAYPLLEGCATFLLDWLIEGGGGLLQTNPSTSPEHKFIAPDGKLSSVSYSTTMDISIIREIFSIMISSAQVLGKSDSSLIKKINQVLPRIPPIKVSREGRILEWAKDFIDSEVHHRHVSHLFGLYPGHIITLDETPDLCKAVANSLITRGDAGPGWSTSWKMALWAHLHNSDHAYKMVKQLFSLVDPDHEADQEGGLYSNLFTAHPPFQIDANFGFTAALSEMLVQSTQSDLFLLPALPRNKWPEGSVKGLKARGGMTASISWKQGQLQEALLWSSHDKPRMIVHYEGKHAVMPISHGFIHQIDRNLKCVSVLPLS